VFKYVLSDIDTDSKLSFCLAEVVTAIHKQKLGKAHGADGIHSEAYIHGGIRLATHMCTVFNLFLVRSYLPDNFMDSVIVPLVKCKGGDLTDVNNYRAITLSNFISKIFESVVGSCK